MTIGWLNVSKNSDRGKLKKKNVNGRLRRRGKYKFADDILSKGFRSEFVRRYLLRSTVKTPERPKDGFAEGWIHSRGENTHNTVRTRFTTGKDGRASTNRPIQSKRSRDQQSKKLRLKTPRMFRE